MTDTAKTDTKREAPSRRSFAREMLAVTDMLGVPGALLGAPRKGTMPERKCPVMLLPGFGAPGFSMSPLGLYLSKHGFETLDWGLGVNRGGKGLITSLDELSDRWEIDRTREHNGEGDVPALCDKVADRVKAAAQKSGGKLHVVGWSLGGYLAREVARDMPDYVQSVVTMGAPVFGGPKYTSVAPLYRAQNVDLDWVEEEIEKRFKNPIQPPLTSIYSKRDGVVGWRAAFDDLSPNITHHEVNISHLGLGLNAKVWKIVLKALCQHDDTDCLT